MQGYHVYNAVGQGAVYRARKKGSLEYVAVRCTPVARLPALAPTLQLWGRLPPHPNIVRLHQWVTSERTLYTVCDLAAGGSLQRALAADGGLPEPSVRLFAADAVCALWFLHRQGLVANCLCASRFVMDENGSLQLGYLDAVQAAGVAGAAPDAGELAEGHREVAVPLRCLPPERAAAASTAAAAAAAAAAAVTCSSGDATPCAALPPPASLAGDFWALGLLLYQLATAAVAPFQGPAALPCSGADALAEAYRWRAPLTLPPAGSLPPHPAGAARAPPSDAFLHLVTGLLHPDPASRMGWAELLTHPWWYEGGEVGGPFPRAACLAAPVDAEGYLVFPAPGHGDRRFRAAGGAGADPWPFSSLAFGLPIATHVCQLPGAGGPRAAAVTQALDDADTSAEVQQSTDDGTEDGDRASSSSALGGHEQGGSVCTAHNDGTGDVPVAATAVHPAVAHSTDNYLTSTLEDAASDGKEEDTPVVVPDAPLLALPTDGEIAAALASTGGSTAYADDSFLDEEDDGDAAAPAVDANDAGAVPGVNLSIQHDSLDAGEPDGSDAQEEEEEDADALGGLALQTQTLSLEPPPQSDAPLPLVPSAAAWTPASARAALCAPLGPLLTRLDRLLQAQALPALLAAAESALAAAGEDLSGPPPASAGTFLFGYEGCPVPVPSMPPVGDGAAGEEGGAGGAASVSSSHSAALPFPWVPPATVRGWAQAFTSGTAPPDTAQRLHAHFRAMYHGIIGSDGSSSSSSSSSSNSSSSDRSLAALAYIYAVAVPPASAEADAAPAAAACVPAGDPAACELLLNSSLSRLLQAMATRSRSLAVQVRAAFVLCVLARFASHISHSVVYKEGLLAALAGGAGWAAGAAGAPHAARGSASGDAGAASPVTRRLALFAVLELLFYVCIQAEEEGSAAQPLGWRPPQWVWTNAATLLQAAASAEANGTATPGLDPQILLVLATFLCNLCLCAPAAARAAAAAIAAGGDSGPAPSPAAAPAAAAAVLLRCAAGAAKHAPGDDAPARGRLVEGAAGWAIRECLRAAALLLRLGGAAVPPDAVAPLASALADASAALAATGLWHWLPPTAPGGARIEGGDDAHTQAALAATPASTWLLEAAAAAALAIAPTACSGGAQLVLPPAALLADVLLPLVRVADQAAACEGAEVDAGGHGSSTGSQCKGTLASARAVNALHVLLAATGTALRACLAQPLAGAGAAGRVQAELAAAVARRGLSALTALAGLQLPKQPGTVVAVGAWLAALAEGGPASLDGGGSSGSGWPLLRAIAAAAEAGLAGTQARLAASLRAVQAALKEEGGGEGSALNDDAASDDEAAGAHPVTLELLPMLLRLLGPCDGDAPAEAAAVAAALALDVAVRAQPLLSLADDGASAGARVPGATTPAWAATVVALPTALCLAPPVQVAAVVGILAAAVAGAASAPPEPAPPALHALSCLLLDDADAGAGARVPALPAAAALGSSLGLVEPPPAESSSDDLLLLLWRAAVAGAASGAAAGGWPAGATLNAPDAAADADDRLLPCGALLRCFGLLAGACVTAGLHPAAAMASAPVTALVPALLVALHACLLPPVGSTSDASAAPPLTASTAAVTWLGQVLPALVSEGSGRPSLALEPLASAVLRWDQPAAPPAFPQPLAALISLVEGLPEDDASLEGEGGGPRAAAAAFLAALCLHPRVAAATAASSDLL